MDMAWVAWMVAKTDLKKAEVRAGSKDRKTALLKAGEMDELMVYRSVACLVCH